MKPTRLLVPVFGLAVALVPLALSAQTCYECHESPWDENGTICAGTTSGGSWQCSQEGTQDEHDCEAWGTCAIMAGASAVDQAIAEVQAGGIPSLDSPYELVADNTSTWLMLKCNGSMVARLDAQPTGAEAVLQWTALPSEPPLAPTPEVPFLAQAPLPALSP